MATSTEVTLKSETDKLDRISAELDAKGTEFTAEDLKRLGDQMGVVHDAIRRHEKTKAVDFLKQLGNDASGHRGGRSASRKAWADQVSKTVTKATGEYGVKAFTTGGIDIPQSVGLVPTTVEPVRVLDLLVNRAPLQGNEFEYLRQTVRTNNAAPVADNATKPTSVYTWEDEFDRARVFAHLSEAIPVRYLDDHEEIRRVLGNQMAEDLALALERDVLIGDGTGEHFTGIANVAGTQAQAYTTDVLTTLRKARTKLTTSGEAPTAWVLNHADLEEIDLIREDGATGGYMGGIDDKIFGNLPVVGSSVIPAGAAYLGDWSETRLFVREQGHLDADFAGVLFEKNQVKLRYEGRFGFAVLKPHAFIEIDLTA